MAGLTTSVSAMRRRALVVVLVLASAACGEAESELRLGSGTGAGGDATGRGRAHLWRSPGVPRLTPGRRGRRAGRDRRRRGGPPLAPRVGRVDAAVGVAPRGRVGRRGAVRLRSRPRRTCVGRRSSTATGRSGSPTSGASASSLPTATASSRPTGSRRARRCPVRSGCALAVTERGCAGGEPPGDRLQPAEVVEASGSVTITFWVRHADRRPDVSGQPADAGHGRAGRTPRRPRAARRRHLPGPGDRW